MEKILVRKNITETVETPVKYPFYRREFMGDNHTNYWQFTNPREATLISVQGVRTVVIQYDNCNSDQTPLTVGLLDAHKMDVRVITKEEFEVVRNALVVDLVKL